jgi:hypothetical protein
MLKAGSGSRRKTVGLLRKTRHRVRNKVKWIVLVTLGIYNLLGVAFVVSALDSDDIICLKKGGISDKIIQLLIKEKSQETYAITVSEVLNLKKAGFSEETIRLVIQGSSFMKNTEPMIYGTTTRTIRLSTAQDLIDLKKAGFSEDVIKAVIIYGSTEGNDLERRQAWEMLQNMGVMVDMRDNKELHQK